MRRTLVLLLALICATAQAQIASIAGKSTSPDMAPVVPADTHDNDNTDLEPSTAPPEDKPKPTFVPVVPPPPPQAGPMDRKGATQNTLSKNAHYLQVLPFSNLLDYNNASKNQMAQPANLVIKGPDGQPIWSLTEFMSFEKIGDPAPDTINPSLWRNALLNMNYGLFEVTDHIYQVRGYDLSVMTVIDAGEGYVVVDPLISMETAKAAFDRVIDLVGDKPILAVIYTHSHVDHFGGVRGIVTPADASSGRVKIIAPEGFMEHAISENVMAGTAMSRRATYMYGSLLPKDAKGNVDAGLGKGTSAGTVSLIPPTDTVTTTGQTMMLGNLTFEFQLTPNTEAPSEMNFHIKELQALCMAENIVHTLHNLYSLRGAQVRDAVSWVKHINESIKLFGDKSDVLFSSHQWPTWGHDDLITLMEAQRDAYKYIHDQTLRMANQGYTMTEIAEQIALPPHLQTVWADRDYYGTVNHNVKAVYQRYLGWFDGNPSHLHPMPAVETSQKTVDYMGGADAILAKAKKDFDAGEYRWVAQVLNDVVFADPSNATARALLADTLEQMGYQSESAAWRNFYLSGAQELRQGVQPLPAASSVSPDIVAAMNMDMILDYLAIRLNGPKAIGVDMTMNWVLPDINQQYKVVVRNSVLNYFPGEQAQNANVTVTVNRQKINDLVLGKATLDTALADGSVKIDGDKDQFKAFFALLDKFNMWFNIVTP